MGLLQIVPNASTGVAPFQVKCSYGKTAIQTRGWSTLDFNRTWESYKVGFGDLLNDFWLGLEKLHYLTTRAHYHLHITLFNYTGTIHIIEYTNITVIDESRGYRLKLGDAVSYYKSDDALKKDSVGAALHSDEMMFSTYDRDNDNSDGNCASKYGGGWWYNNCTYVNLNGYTNADGSCKNDHCLFWKTIDSYGTMPLMRIYTYLRTP